MPSVDDCIFHPELRKIRDQTVSDVETLRSLLETYYKSASCSFAQGEQQYVGDALNYLLQNLPNSENGMATLVTQKVCQKCTGENPKTIEETTSGCIITLPRQDTIEKMLHQKSEGTLEYTCCQPANEKEIPITETCTITEAKDFLTILAKRDPAQPETQQDIYPSEKILINGKRYQIRSVITHYGNTLNSGHYNTAVFNQNRWFMVNDFDTISEFKCGNRYPKKGLFFIYEIMEDTDPDPLVVKDITYLPPLVNESNKGKKARIPHEIVNKETIKENIRTMLNIHSNGLNELNHGRTNSINLTPDNPALVHGLKMFEKLKKTYIRGKPCKICQESWFGLHVNQQNGMCSRCERLAKQQKYTFGKGNSMVPSEIPDCLSDLTYIEQCAIKIANPFFSVYCRRGGKTGMVGHTITYERDVQGLATILPRY